MKNPLCYCNGQILAFNEAHIKLNDRGLLLADGFFETILIYKQQPVLLAEHWQRLCETANYFGVELPFNYSYLETLLQKLIKHNHAADQAASIRITMTRGYAWRGLKPNSTITTNCFITTAKITIKHNPLSLGMTPIKRNQFSPSSRRKTLNYVDTILALQKTQQDDVLFCNTIDNICCTSCANIFVVKNNQLYTPKIEDGVLPGIMRNFIIKLCHEANITVTESSIALNKLATADEVFISNSLRLVQSVKSIDHYRYDNFNYCQQLLGLITQRLQLNH